MRTFFLFGGLLCLAGILFVKGYLLKPAGAAGNRDGGTEPEIRFEYTDYEDERPPALPERPPQPDEPAADRTREAPSAPEPGVPASNQKPEHFDALAAPSFPEADAGADRIVWIGDREIKLDGSASRGSGLSYSWRQLSGPLDLEITSAQAGRTTATGFALDWPTTDPVYEFELTVRDTYGEEAVAVARYAIRAAPSIAVVPTPKRRLAYREGYLLAHFEAWKTNRGDDAEVFEIRSPSELTFHQLSGPTDFEVAPAESSSGFAYQLLVYYREGESTSFLEFFVDTPERIPAILQLGVNWE